MNFPSETAQQIFDSIPTAQLQINLDHCQTLINNAISSLERIRGVFQADAKKALYFMSNARTGIDNALFGAQRGGQGVEESLREAGHAFQTGQVFALKVDKKFKSSSPDEQQNMMADPNLVNAVTILGRDLPTAFNAAIDEWEKVKKSFDAGHDLLPDYATASPEDIF